MKIRLGQEFWVIYLEILQVAELYFSKPMLQPATSVLVLLHLIYLHVFISYMQLALSF